MQFPSLKISKYYVYIINIIISFMQGIYTYIPETHYVPREYSVAAILLSSAPPPPPPPPSSSSSAGVNTICTYFTVLTQTHNRMLQYTTGLPLMFKTFGANFQFL